MAKAEYYVPDERPWFKFYPEGAPHHLDYPEVPLYQFLDDSAEKYPERPALIFYGKKISYRELKELSDKFARALQEFGIQKGDRIFLLLPNCPQFVIAFYGAMKIGAVPIPFNPLYSAEELKYFFHDAEPRIVLSLDTFYDKVQEAAKVTPQIEKIIVTSIADYFPSFQRAMGKLFKKIPSPQCPNAVSFLDFIKESEPKYNPVQINPKEDIAVIIYTGGTTGEPKGVMLTHFNILSNMTAVDCILNTEKIKISVWLTSVPFFHIYGIGPALQWGIMRQATIILLPKFNSKEAIGLIRKYKVDYFPGIPAMYSAFLNYYEKNKKEPILNSVNIASSGSSSFPASVIEKIKEILPNAFLMEVFGATETSPGITMDMPGKNYKKKNNTVGIPFLDTDVKIINYQTKEELPYGEVGEIIVRGPQIFKGYWRKPEKTKEVLRDGWFYTKDIGRIDNDGLLYIEGRLDDMINVRGEKVWPREVEEVLEQNPKVRDVAVIGVTDDYYGQAIKACVVLKEGEMATEEEMIEFCREKLAPYKVPHLIEFFEELPKSNLGKTMHYKLREREQK